MTLWNGHPGYSIFAGTMADMPYTEVERRAREGALALLPVGVIEAHGPHLPLGVDAYGAYALSRLAEQSLTRQGFSAIVAPPFYWGINHGLGTFVGSFTVRPQTAQALLHDVCDSLVSDGFEQIVVVNHQGDRVHGRVLGAVLAERWDQGRGRLYWAEEPDRIERYEGDENAPYWLPYQSSNSREYAMSGRIGVHADERETSFMLRWFPELVGHEVLDELEPTDLTTEDLARWREGPEQAAEITPNAYLGAPRPLDVGLWRRYLDQAEAIADAILTGVEVPRIDR